MTSFPSFMTSFPPPSREQRSGTGALWNDVDTQRNRWAQAWLARQPFLERLLSKFEQLMVSRGFAFKEHRYHGPTGPRQRRETACVIATNWTHPRLSLPFTVDLILTVQWDDPFFGMTRLDMEAYYHQPDSAGPPGAMFLDMMVSELEWVGRPERHLLMLADDVQQRAWHDFLSDNAYRFVERDADRILGELIDRLSAHVPA
jgi:hypothetical protein